MKQWTDTKKYVDAGWAVKTALPSGAQGSSSIATRGDVTAFLKALSKNGDDERRARFYQEASAYFQYDHPRLPKLIESNAQNFRDHDFKLYLVSELVDGPNLETLIEESGPLSLPDALDVTFGLLDVLGYLHTNEFVHRDVKPANIVLRDRKPSGLVLVDLGIGHDARAAKGHETHIGEELGNRFLRLPELRIGSPAKRDPRSDLAFAAAILLYCMTAIVPAGLLDEAGRMPHQRDDVLAALQRQVPEHALFYLLDLFDKGFENSFHARHASAEDLRTALTRVRDATPQLQEPTLIDLEKALKERVEASKYAPFKRVHSSLKTSLDLISAIHQSVVSEVAPVLASSVTGYNLANNEISYSLGFSQSGDRNKKGYVDTNIETVGDELVFRLNGQVVYRTSVERPALSPSAKDSVRKVFVETALKVEDQ